MDNDRYFYFSLLPIEVAKDFSLFTSLKIIKKAYQQRYPTYRSTRTQATQWVKHGLEKIKLGHQILMCRQSHKLEFWIIYIPYWAIFFIHISVFVKDFNAISNMVVVRWLTDCKSQYFPIETNIFQTLVRHEVGLLQDNTKRTRKLSSLSFKI